MSSSITIVGMGACGVAAFADLTIRVSAVPVEGLTVNLVERDEKLGQGLAFGTDQPGHLLNTESRLMGLYDREPEHFRRWLQRRREARGRPLDPGAVEYAPRSEYGDYLREVLHDAHERARRAGISVAVHRSEAVAMEGDRERSEIVLADGTRIPSAYTLLALGTPKPLTTNFRT